MDAVNDNTDALHFGFWSHKQHRFALVVCHKAPDAVPSVQAAHDKITIEAHGDKLTELKRFHPINNRDAAVVQAARSHQVGVDGEQVNTDRVIGEVGVKVDALAFSVR